MDWQKERFVEFWATYTYNRYERRMLVRFYFFGSDKADYYEIRTKKGKSGIRNIKGTWCVISGLPMNNELLQRVGAGIMREMPSIV